MPFAPADRAPVAAKHYRPSFRAVAKYQIQQTGIEIDEDIAGIVGIDGNQIVGIGIERKYPIVHTRRHTGTGNPVARNGVGGIASTNECRRCARVGQLPDVGLAWQIGIGVAALGDHKSAVSDASVCADAHATGGRDSYGSRTRQPAHPQLGRTAATGTRAKTTH